MRHIYLLFAAAFLVTLAGFWPTFYSGGEGLDGWRIAHGALATLWSVMLIAQTWLVGHRQPKLHRVIGWTSVVVVPALLASSLWVVHLMLAAQGSGGAPFDTGLRLVLTFIDWASLALFALLWVLALVYRKQWRLHARYLGLTALPALPPALGRLLGMNVEAIGGLPGALGPSFWTIYAILVTLIVYDWRKGRVLPPYFIALAAFVAIELCMWRAPGWGWFLSLARAGGLSA